jgi:hypothetical protein
MDMSLLSRVTQSLSDVFEVLLNEYGFVIQIESETRLLLRSSRCVIILSFERYGRSFFVSLANPHDMQGEEYNFLLIMALRCPNYRASVRRSDDALSEEENLLLNLRELSDYLHRYCCDLLLGDFTALQREGYQEFASFIQSRTPVVLNLPKDDPIAVKFWRGDLSWAKDLRERESGTDPKRV